MGTRQYGPLVSQPGGLGRSQRWMQHYYLDPAEPASQPGQSRTRPGWPVSPLSCLVSLGPWGHRLSNQQTSAVCTVPAAGGRPLKRETQRERGIERMGKGEIRSTNNNKKRLAEESQESPTYRVANLERSQSVS